MTYRQKINRCQFPTAVLYFAKILKSYINRELVSAFRAPYIVLALSAFNSQLCLAVLASYVAVGFNVSYLVFLSYKEGFNSVLNFHIDLIFSASAVEVF